MYWLQAMSVEKSHVAKQIKELHGGYNDFPKGWVEIAESDVCEGQMFFLYTPDAIESRQMFAKDERGLNTGPLTQATLYFFHDGTGVAIGEDYKNKRVRWFRFGCVHEYRSLSSQECAKRNIYHAPRCYSVSECKKCGHVKSIDSSD